MDILVIGGSGNITNGILKKLHKEGNRIFILSGNKEKIFTYKHVFEQYSFSYESNSIKEIFESISPDVTIFMGAYDTNFDWRNARKESVRYAAGLLNILMGYSLVKCGRFIYLSSDLVFHNSYSDNITEDTQVSATDFRGMAIAQGEELCEKYQKFDGLDIVILRMDHLYGLPENRKETDNICAKMCIQAIRTGKIQADSRHYFSMLYLSDAVEFLYQIVSTAVHERSLYHISSSREISEMYLAELIKKELGDEIEIEDVTGREAQRLVLSCSRFREEFSAKIFHPVSRVVPRMVEQIRQKREEMLAGEERADNLLARIKKNARKLVQALAPFVENGLCFILFFMLNNRAAGSTYFNKLDFYLLYVLLFSIIYGQQQATVSAVLATAGYCFRQMYNRSGFDVVLDYNTYVWVAQLFILGLVVGHLRDQLAIVKRESQSEVSYLSGQIDDIQDINSSNTRIKNVLEEQIMNHNQSVGKIYDITAELDQYAPEEVIFYAAEVVARLLDCRDVAIYSVANGDFARLFSATTPKARSMGNSIRYREMKEFYAAIADKKVFINKSLNRSYPMLAGGIFEENRLRLIVMVWGIPWERMNLSTANLLTVIGYLIQNAVLRANRYQRALEKERYREGTKILEKEAFGSLVRAYMNAQRRGLTECALLAVDMTREQATVRSEELGKLLRSTDYIGELENGHLYVLLSNTNQEGAQIVRNRFADIGCRTVYQEEFAS